MPVNMENLRKAIREFDIKRILMRELGWDQCQLAPQPISCDGKSWTLNAIAQKRGLVVFQCEPGSDGRIPDFATRNKIERQIAKTAYEHMVVYVDAAKSAQVWQWAKKETGKPVQRREASYHSGAQGEALAQRLRKLAFTLDEEGRLTQPEVIARTSEAMRADKVTKRFYERFTKEHSAFLKFIEGIRDVASKEWYASLMLNRMMFVYFIQKKGFLDGDHNYLRNRLKMMQQRAGRGNFHDFYRKFLLVLFHSGLGQQEAQRLPAIRELLGKVPYLNGGLFDEHSLEESNKTIRIPDEAFERVFEFFEEYDWHLDNRPGRTDHEINPDVLGHIFEKYINQKQMGAYYTKEDITGYISRNTVIPFLFDYAKSRCSTAFKDDGGVWRLLKENPDRYIYPSVKHGLTWDYHTSSVLGSAVALPKNIADGIKDVGKRGDWNKVATQETGLPTETWREVVARRQRYDEIVTKLTAGKVNDINELVTLNLDIERFALDVIEQAEGSDLVKAFWEGVTKISVLDPTCGSGAFLFAALEILKPIYDACLTAMAGFVEDIDRSGEDPRKKKLEWARTALEQAAKHPSEDYFIYKSIVIGNLFGVDIMEEAVEICKLRLFLKLVAQVQTVDQIEPLPDIDFNIRPGNTLLGFLTLAEVRSALKRKLDFDNSADSIRTKAEDTQQILNTFRKRQTEGDGSVPTSDKQQLRSRLGGLDLEVSRILALDHSVDASKDARFIEWRKRSQPLNWFVEFYGIMANGGFDVVIGNPPYVSSRSVDYELRRSDWGGAFPDIYAYVFLRSLKLLSERGRLGLIVPLSIQFSRDFSALRTQLLQDCSHWVSAFDNIPAALFQGVSQRCSVWLLSRRGSERHLTGLHRWRAVSRPQLFELIRYGVAPDGACSTDGVLKLESAVEAECLSAIVRAQSKSGSNPIVFPRTSHSLHFSATARNFLSAYTEPPPALHVDTLRRVESDQGGELNLRDEQVLYAAMAVASTDTAFWYWLICGDAFHVTSGFMQALCACLSSLRAEPLGALARIGETMSARLADALVFKKNAGKYVGNFNFRRMPDLVLRADLTFLDAIGVSRETALALLERVTSIRSVNVAAGEKGITPEIHQAAAKLLPRPKTRRATQVDAADQSSLVGSLSMATISLSIHGDSDSVEGSPESEHE